MDTWELIRELGDFVAPFSHNIPDTLCKNHSLAYFNGLLNGTSWAKSMWDSSAKLQSGLLTGNLNSFGNFDECISVTDVQHENGNFSGQHCLTTLNLVNVSKTDVMGNILGQIMDQEEMINMGLGSLLSKGMRWGICIPSSCTPEDLTVAMSAYFGNESGVNVSVNDTDCHTESANHFSSVDNAAIIIFLGLLLVVILSTGYEFFKEFMNGDIIRRWNLQPSSSTISLASMDTNPTTSTSGFEAHPHGAKYPSEMPRTGVVEISCSNGEGSSRQLLYPGPSQSSLTRSGSGYLPDGSHSSSSSNQSLHPKAMTQFLEAQASRRREEALMETPQTTSTESEKGLAPEGNVTEIFEAGTNIPQQPEDASPTRTPTPLDSEFDPWTTFSLLSNGKKVFSFEHPKYTLKSLYGIKFLSICWVIIAHTCSMTDSLPAINYMNITQFTSRWPAVLLLNVSLSADTFLVISGVLITYNFLTDMKRRGIYRRTSNRLSRTGLQGKFFIRYLPVYYLHRYARLTPALAAVLLFQVSLLKHLGSGPFWDAGNGYDAEVCRENWAGTLTYLQNYISPDKICLVHSWYLMVDMQLYVISPIILLLLLAWNKKRALITVGVLIWVGMFVTFNVNYWLKLPVGLPIDERSKWPLKNMYDNVATHTRFSSWMIGNAVGYILYSYRTKGKIEIEMSPTTLLFGWVSTTMAFVYSLFGVITFQHPNYEVLAVSDALYNSTYHAFWSLGVGWIIIACESNYGGVIHSMLSWKLFQPLSRLTFCMYLVHMPLMASKAFMTRVPIYSSGINVLCPIFGDILSCILLAIALSLCVELPFIRLFKYVTMKVGLPVRQTTPLNGSWSLPERVPLLRDLAIGSYQALASRMRICSQTTRTQSTASISNLAPIRERIPMPPASAVQQVTTLHQEGDSQTGVGSSEISQQVTSKHAKLSSD
ncbi:Nose resistant to fluoxetine protein 6 [Zootermopsis nevadensis]|uniref:Nose resistant to fluoxetine protein 6 n=2 Tax=Zootermopsis nevadensis TaxID=136037 RepID=A0A067RBJ7_ZOONE|nr:Nose resistant to fluoxetine protein 6 [Zootermopsis nevadensis]